MAKLIHLSKLCLKAFFSPIRGYFFSKKIERLNLRSLLKETSPREVWVFGAVEDFAFVIRYFYYLRAVLIHEKAPKIIWLNTALRFNTNSPHFKRSLIDFLTNNTWTLRYWKTIYSKLLPGAWLTFMELTKKHDRVKEAKAIFSKIKSKEDLIRLVYENVLIGDLIYDTYLRFRPAETVDLSDGFMLELIEKAMTLVHVTSELLDGHKVTRVINSYSAYIHHGILVRAALKQEIIVHTLGLVQQPVSRPTSEFPYHKRNFWLFREWFKQIPNPTKALVLGKEILEKRLSGVIDSSTSYMRKSAYSSDERVGIISGPILDSRPKVLMMAHDFYDSPHIYGDMLFCDFLEWVIFVLEASKNSPYQFLVKIHPNSMPESVEVWRHLQRQYSSVTFLDPVTSNLAVLKLNLEFVLTVYGTVTHEFAYRNIPVVTCADNPHSAYSFSLQVKDRVLYRDLLEGKEKVQIKINADEIFEFVFVSNYRILNDSLPLLSFDVDQKKFLAEIQRDPKARTDQMWRGILNVDTI